jgi:hypothetical protein
VTDKDGNRVQEEYEVHHRNPGGRSGPSGRNGTKPTTILRSGNDGSDGRVNMQVFGSRGEIKSYPDRYKLIVERFDVADENQDSINEPGEYLIVKNVVVRNKGLFTHLSTARNLLIRLPIRIDAITFEIAH